jgi:hypothetical protein
VAAGETSNRGRDHPSAAASASVAPATFARLVAAAAPHLPLAAWATHPYATRPWLGPEQKVRWPNVTMAQIPHLADSLRRWFRWFHRRVPIWITEYGGQTTPHYPHGVSPRRQARDAQTALRMARSDPSVQLFTWFVLRDSRSTWKSGLLTAAGTRKQAYAAFRRVAHSVAGRSVTVRAGRSPALTVPMPFLGTTTPSAAGSASATRCARPGAPSSPPA